MHQWIVRVAVIVAIFLAIGAFYTYGQKVEQLNRAQRQLTFINGAKTRALCTTAKTSRDLWTRLSILVADEDFRRAVNSYVNSANPSCLKAPR